jgi:hypothetical protein
MKGISIIFIFLLFASCNTGESFLSSINGIWIPNEINWVDGNFNTIYFYHDTSFIIISSTQKNICDSIYFQAEPGFNIRQGKIIEFDLHRAETLSQTLYRYFTLPGDSTPSCLIRTTLLFDLKGKNITSLTFLGVKYERTYKYTSRSVTTIENIASKMIPELKMKYGIK